MDNGSEQWAAFNEHYTDAGTRQFSGYDPDSGVPF